MSNVIEFKRKKPITYAEAVEQETKKLLKRDLTFTSEDFKDCDVFFYDGTAMAMCVEMYHQISKLKIENTKLKEQVEKHKSYQKAIRFCMALMILTNLFSIFLKSFG